MSSLKSSLSSLSQSVQSTLKRQYELQTSLSLDSSVNLTAIPPVNPVENSSDTDIVSPTPTGNSTQTDADSQNVMRYDDPTPVPDTVVTGTLPPSSIPPEAIRTNRSGNLLCCIK